MSDGCEQWWERTRKNLMWSGAICNRPWDHLEDHEQEDIRAIYEAAILPQDEDDRELREQAANLTRHPWERGMNKEEMR